LKSGRPKSRPPDLVFRHGDDLSLVRALGRRIEKAIKRPDDFGLPPNAQELIPAVFFLLP
jgi:hypothetical protein